MSKLIPSSRFWPPPTSVLNDTKFLWLEDKLNMKMNKLNKPKQKHIGFQHNSDEYDNRCIIPLYNTSDLYDQLYNLNNSQQYDILNKERAINK